MKLDRPGRLKIGGGGGGGAVRGNFEQALNEVIGPLNMLRLVNGFTWTTGEQDQDFRRLRTGAKKTSTLKPPSPARRGPLRKFERGDSHLNLVVISSNCRLRNISL